MVKKKKTNDKQKIVYAILYGILFLIFLTSVVATAKWVNYSLNNNVVAESSKPAADHLKQMAIDDMRTKPEHALQLFETAIKQYKYVVDNSDVQAERDAAQNDIIDCDALIWAMQH